MPVRTKFASIKIQGMIGQLQKVAQYRTRLQVRKQNQNVTGNQSGSRLYRDGGGRGGRGVGGGGGGGRGEGGVVNKGEGGINYRPFGQ